MLVLSRVSSVSFKCSNLFPVLGDSFLILMTFTKHFSDPCFQLLNIIFTNLVLSFNLLCVISRPLNLALKLFGQLSNLLNLLLKLLVNLMFLLDFLLIMTLNQLHLLIVKLTLFQLLIYTIDVLPRLVQFID